VLEHVRVAVGIKHPRRGDLILRIYSPDGTSSELLSRRRKDEHPNIAFAFMTVRNWGENPAGEWTLEVENVGEEEGVLEEFYLELYGYQTQMETRHLEGVAEIPSPVQVDHIFEKELEETERLRLKRVAKVLMKFSEEDRRAVLSAMLPVKRKFVVSEISAREEEEKAREVEDGGRRMAKKELNAEEEIETMQQLVDMIEKF